MSRTDDTAALLDALFGDGTWEISKRLTEKEKRTQARVGLASNIVGLAAGVVGTKDAAQKLHEVRLKKKGITPHTPRHASPGKFSRTATKYAVPVAAGALGLQVANNVGDVIANQVLARESKKKISKSYAAQYKVDATKAGVNGAATALKKAPATAASTANTGAKVIKWSGKKMAKIEHAVDSQAAAMVKKDLDFEIRGEISKMDTEKKQVFGWASVIEVNGEPVIDLQGDVMTIDTIEKAAYDYVHTSRKGGRQHQRDGEQPLHVSDMIESFVLTPEKKERMGLPDTVPTGWWVGFQINDDDTWTAYKDGELKEFSIHGSGTRKELAL